VETIISFRRLGGGAGFDRDPLAYYRNNTMTTRSLLNAAVKGGVNRFIFSSTARCTGNPDQVPVPENAPTRPTSPYGSSKLMAEIMLHDVASAHGLNYVVLRYFNVAGADPLGAHWAGHRRRDASVEDRGRGGNRTARQDRCVWNRLSERRTAAASGTSSTSATSHRRIGGIVLSAGRRSVGDAELRLRPRLLGESRTIEAVRRVSGRNFAVQYAPRRPGDIMTMIADTSRIRSVLDWTPQYDDLEPSPPTRWRGRRN